MPKEVDRDTRIYLAGIFDGEGCVLISRANRRGEAVQHQLVCSVGMTDPEAIGELYSNYGGHVQLVVMSEPRKPRLQWNITSKRAEKFIRDILPFVRVKAAQLELALEFAKECINNRVGNTKRLTDAEVAQRDRYRVKLSEMKDKRLNDDFDIGLLMVAPVEDLDGTLVS